jgi:hypothetical protein
MIRLGLLTGLCLGRTEVGRCGSRSSSSRPSGFRAQSWGVGIVGSPSQELTVSGRLCVQTPMRLTWRLTAAWKGGVWQSDSIPLPFDSSALLLGHIVQELEWSADGGEAALSRLVQSLGLSAHNFKAPLIIHFASTVTSLMVCIMFWAYIPQIHTPLESIEVQTAVQACPLLLHTCKCFRCEWECGSQELLSPVAKYA